MKRLFPYLLPHSHPCPPLPSSRGTAGRYWGLLVIHIRKRGRVRRVWSVCASAVLSPPFSECERTDNLLEDAKKKVPMITYLLDLP